MAPELLNSIDAEELQGLAAKVLEYQDAKKLSDSALYRKFSGLGSTTTYKKILKGDLKELNLEKQLTNYRAVVALIEASRDDSEEEALFDNFVSVLEVRRAFMATSNQSSIARFILVQGDTGTGKSSSRKELINKLGNRVISTEASETWGDKPNAFLGAILRAFGEKDLPVAENERMLRVIDRLRMSRVGVITDEGHHMGPRCLNTMKTLINETPGEFITFAMGTLWGRLERAAYQEVKQLTGNRLAERVKLVLYDTDIEKYLKGRLNGLAGAELKKSVEYLYEHAPSYGNLAFVRNACRAARELCDDGDVTFNQLVSAAQGEVKKR